MKAKKNSTFHEELKIHSKNRLVYAKRPLGSVYSVIDYLGRYTHKIVVISNHRLQDLSDGKISFSYKDYKEQGKKKVITL